MKNKPLVSICCAAYNHEKYIEDTLNGFLMQDVDFDYEILIHDDASTDNTAQIIRQYEKKYPDKIFPIYQIENQYSQGKKYSDLNYERVKGKYVAICEGDDYWTDPLKLRLQIQAMEKNPTCEISFHSALSKNCLTNKETIIGKYDNKNSIIDINDVIIKKHDMIPTASCIVTKNVLQKVLEYKSTRSYLTVGDLYFQIFGSLQGGAIYIDRIMSVYRHFTPQSWSMSQDKSFDNQIKHLLAMAKSYQELDAITENKYTKAFQQSTIKRLFSVTGYESFDDFPKEFYPYKILFRELLNQLLVEDNYLIYGASVCSRLILNEMDKKIEYIIDRDRDKHNTKYFNKPIKAIDFIKTFDDKKIIIALVGRSNEIVNFLIKKYSLKKEQFIVFDDFLIEADLLKELDFQ